MPIRLYRHSLPISSKPSIACIGNFDGLHQGHQQIIQKTVERANQFNCTSVVITFEPSPSEILAKKTFQFKLMSWRQKVNALKKLGVEQVILLRFNLSLAKLSPQSFVEKYIKPLNVKSLILGEDFRFGHQQKGDIAWLEKQGFSVEVIATQYLNERKISSSWLRESLIKHDLVMAKKLLGRHYCLEAKVVKGEQKATQLGFPTANMRLPNKMPFLKGVFLTRVQVDNDYYFALTNVGVKPTFLENKKYIAESFLLNFNNNLYGKNLKIEFLSALREEKKFHNLDALKSQILADLKQAQRLIKLNDLTTMNIGTI